MNFKLTFFIPVIIINIIINTYQTNAQPWLHFVADSVKLDTEPDFFEIQEAFYNYTEATDNIKQSSWKQFKRWENFMLPRLYKKNNAVLATDKLWKASLERTENAKNATSFEVNYWENCGPKNPPVWLANSKVFGAGRLNTVAFHPTDENIMWVGAPSGGIWKTTDAGKTWATTTDNLPAIGVSDIIVDQRNPEIIYIATGDADGLNTYSYGILKSTDGGNSWQTTGLEYQFAMQTTIRRLKMMPDNSDIILAASSKGILKSIDAGQTWQIKKSGKFMDIEFNPANPQIIYASTYNSRGEIYRSIDGGETFTKLSTNFTSIKAGRTEIAVSKNSPDLVVALVSDNVSDGLYGIYKSIDAGLNWTKLIDGTEKNLLGWESNGSDAGGQGWYDLALEISPTNAEEIYVGGINIWRSTNGGSRWDIDAHYSFSFSANPVHADHHFFKFNQNTNTLFSCNDGGLYKRENNGTWTDLTSNLQILQIYKIGVSQRTDNYCITGTQDIGSVLNSSADFWHVVLGGDGMECAIDQANDKTLFCELYNGILQRSTDGGATFKDIKPATADTGAWVTPFQLDWQLSGNMVAAYNSIFTSNNYGNTWQKISDNLANGNPHTAIAVSPIDRNFIWVSYEGRLWKTENAGTNWIELSGKTAKFAENFITSIALSHNDINKVCVSYSGFSETRVIYSNDSGNSWFDISNGLPDIPVNVIVFQKDNNERLYAGTDIGVYYCNNIDDETGVWKSFSNGLPNVIVNDIDFQYLNENTTYLYAATYGRGVWKAHAIPAANFSASKTKTGINDVVEFCDKSYMLPQNHQWNFGQGASPETATGAGPHSVIYSTAGKKTITLTITENEKTDTEIKENFITVFNNFEVELFPNPCRDFIDLNFYTQIPAEIEIKIYSSDGKLYYEQNFQSAENLFEQRILTSSFQAGLYVISLKSGDEQLSKTFVVY